MTDRLNRIRKSVRRPDVSGGDAVGRLSDLPLDHQLTFSPEYDEQWTFKDDRWICLNNEEVEKLVTLDAGNVALLCGVSQGLSEYQQHVWSKGGKAFEKFNAAVGALQGRIVGKLNRIYEDITGGVRFEVNGNDFWINNVNVRSVLNLYKLRPTQKARCYLAGFRDKLGLILSERSSSTRYDGVSESARKLFDEISLALEYIPSDAPYRITDGRRIA